MQLNSIRCSKNQKTKTGNYLGFTLVELIVVITILVILGTIAFVNIGGYSASARDSNRVSDLTNISKWLDVFLIKRGAIPAPNANTMDITTSTATIGYQGYAGTGVLSAISMSNAQDPLDKRHYTYFTDAPYKKYQLLGLFENSATSISGPNVRYPSVRGSRLGVFLGNTGSTLNQPIQELYDPASFTGVNVMTTSSGYTVLLSNAPSDQLSGSAAVIAQVVNTLAPITSYPFTRTLGWWYTSNAQGTFVDSYGYVYIVGVFTSNIPNSGSVNDFSSKALSGASVVNSSDIYIAKLNSFGQQIWIKTMGGSGSDLGRAVTADLNGNIYVTGYYANNSSDTNVVKDFAGNLLPGISGATGNDGFIAKLSSIDGSQVWIKTMGWDGGDLGRGIVTDSNNSIYTVGNYVNDTGGTNNTKDYAGNPLLGVSWGGFSDGYVAKLSSIDGSQIWIKTMGWDGSDTVASIALDSNNGLYIVGSYSNTYTDTNNTKDYAGNPLLGTSGVSLSDGYIAKLSGNAWSQIWIETIGGSSNDVTSSLSVDLTGGVYVAGYYTNNTGGTNGTKDFAGNPLLGVSGSDGYTAKLSSDNGSQTWIKTIGGSSNDITSGISVDSNGNVYVVWNYTNKSTNINGVNDFTGVPLPGVSGTTGLDGFIAKLSGTSGLQTWIKTMGGAQNDAASSVSVDSGGNVYVAWSHIEVGTFHGTKDFEGNHLYGNSAASTTVFLERL